MRAYGRDVEPTDPVVPTSDGDPAEDRAPPESESVAAALLASARHELRSPLQSVQGFAELLESQHYGALSEEQLAFVKHILQASGELGATLEATFELMELELGLFPLQPSLVSVQPLLDEALAHAAGFAGCAVRLAPPSGLAAARAKLDEQAVRRAVEGLVMAVSPGKEPLGAQLVREGECVCLRVTRVPGAFGAALRSVDELAATQRAGRGLVWLRLAAMLVAQHGGLLTATDQAERAEVRLRLSSTH